ncbi:MAG: hypothetical protein GC181_08320 [Bacteroidetes bacterium]|nr:hypothetical protein [Bacteroidota bacterium]
MKNDWLNKLSRALEENMPPGTNVARTLADILGVSQESAYRRLRGQTSFLLEEVLLLRREFGISIDHLEQPGDEISIRFRSLFSSANDLSEHLINVRDELRYFLKESQTKLICLAADIPFFRLLGQHHLGAFKLFYWQRSILGISEMQNSYFHPDKIQSEILEVCAQIAADYSNGASEEIWNEQTVNGTLKQIEYYADCGYFADDRVLLATYNDMIQLVFNVAEEARAGYKNSATATYALWNCELIIDNNTVLVEHPHGDSLAIGFNSFNAFRCSHLSLITEYRAWLNAMMSKSTLLSGQSDKHRIRFVRQLSDRILTSAQNRLSPALMEELKELSGSVAV